MDFVCLEERLVIELDGSQHLDQQAYDANRTQWLTDEGYRVIRFWDNEALKEIGGVIDAILQALGQAPSGPA